MPEGSSGGGRAPGDPDEDILIRRWLRTADEMVRGAQRKGGTSGRKGGEREEPGRRPSGDRRDVED
jgi:hypothetical protein